MANNPNAIIISAISILVMASFLMMAVLVGIGFCEKYCFYWYIIHEIAIFVNVTRGYFKQYTEIEKMGLR